ncbi:hypothetical protein HDU81_006679 [Chytriomyces hyalinus]|nr:hypothetical protein HDU81_006679 [Chytriomyces hyalinus]
MLAQENAAYAAILALAAGMAASQLSSSEFGPEKSHIQDSFAASAEALLLHRTVALTLTEQRSNSMSALSLVRAMLPSIAPHTALCLHERLVTAALLMHAIDELDSGNSAELSGPHDWSDSAQSKWSSFALDQETMKVPTSPSSLSISFEESAADIDTLLSGLPQPASQLISLFETHLQSHKLRNRSAIAREAWTTYIHPFLKAYTLGRMASASPPLLNPSKSLPTNARHSIIDLYFNLSTSHAPPPLMESSPSLSSSSLHSTQTATPDPAVNIPSIESCTSSSSPNSPCFLENDASIHFHSEISDMSRPCRSEKLSQPPFNDTHQQPSAPEPPFLPEPRCSKGPLQTMWNGSRTVLEDSDVDGASWDINSSRNLAGSVEGDNFIRTESTTEESDDVAFEIDKEAADFPIELINRIAATIKRSSSHRSAQITSNDAHALSPSDLMLELLLSSRVLPQSRNQMNSSLPTAKQNENQLEKTESQISVNMTIVGAKAIVSSEDGTGARDVFCRVHLCGDDGGAQTQSDPTDAREFATDVCVRTCTPAWYHDVHFECDRARDGVEVSVWDARGGDFLGKVSLQFSELWSRVGRGSGEENSDGSIADEGIDGHSIRASDTAGATDKVSVSGWHALEPKKGSTWDPYVGGLIYLEIRMALLNPPVIQQERECVDFIIPQALCQGFQLKPEDLSSIEKATSTLALFEILMKACIQLSLPNGESAQETPATKLQPQVIRRATTLETITSISSKSGVTCSNSSASTSPPCSEGMNLLSSEMKRVLGVWGVVFNISKPSQALVYFQVLLSVWKDGEPCDMAVVLNAYEYIHINMKRDDGWFGRNEIIELKARLSEIYARLKESVQNYKQVYTDRLSALEPTLLLMRMLSKNSVFRKDGAAASFRAELKCLISESATAQFGNLLIPLDNNELEPSTSGIKQIVVFISALTQDLRFQSKTFSPYFEGEVQLLKILSETYAQGIASVVESSLAMDARINAHLSEVDAFEILDLFVAAKTFLRTILKLSPSSMKSHQLKQIDLHAWFSPFVDTWMKHLVALDASKFEESPQEQLPTVSSSSAILACCDYAFDKLSAFYDFEWREGVVHMDWFVGALGKTFTTIVNWWAYAAISANSVFSTAWLLEQKSAGTNRLCIVLCVGESLFTKLCTISNTLSAFTQQQCAVNGKKQSHQEESETSTQWLTECQRCIDTVQLHLIQTISTEISNCTDTLLRDAVRKENTALTARAASSEATPLSLMPPPARKSPKRLLSFKNLTSQPAGRVLVNNTVPLIDVGKTVSGALVDSRMDTRAVQLLLADLFSLVERTMSALPRGAIVVQVVKTVWRQVVCVVLDVLDPFKSLDGLHPLLNRRQVSLCEAVLQQYHELLSALVAEGHGMDETLPRGGDGYHHVDVKDERFGYFEWGLLGAVEQVVSVFIEADIQARCSLVESVRRQMT